MAEYFNDAKRCAGEIKYYYDHAGAKGYQQALFYFNRLNALLHEARLFQKYKMKCSLSYKSGKNAKKWWKLWGIELKMIQIEQIVL